MSFQTVQDQVVTLLQGMSDFDTGNSGADDFRKLAPGKASYGIVIKGATGGPNSGQVDIADGNKSYVRRDDYSVEIHLFTRYVTDALQTRGDLTTLVDAVEAHFDKYPDLDNFTGVIDSRIDVVPESTEWTLGSGNYWRQVIVVQVAELSTVLIAETHAGVIMRWDGETLWDGSGEWG